MRYVTLFLSFATVLIMWVYHHRLFQSVRQAETPLLFANGFLLLLVTVVPFPTAIVGAYLTTSAASVACAVYAGFFVLINASFNLLWWVVIRQQRQAGLSTTRLNRSIRFSLLGLPCYLVATLAAFVNPYLTLAICTALWVVWALTAPSGGLE